MTAIERGGDSAIEQDINIGDYVAVFKRRWLLLAIPTIVGTTLAVAIAFILPPVYTSTARILVESQQIPSDLARSTVTADAPERVRLIEQRVKTRQNMLGLSERFGIHKNRPDLSPSDIIDLMRDATVINSVALSQRDGNRGPVTASLINITFEADRPQLAAQVAGELLSQVLEENARQRGARAADTLVFFDREVERLSLELASLETRITRFKNDNADALPDSLEFRRKELSDLQQRMFERESQRIGLEEEKRYLERTLALGFSAPEAQLTPEERELQSLRRSLTQARSVFAESHPSVRSLTARIAALEQILGGAGGGAGGDAGAPVNGQATEALRKIELIESRLKLLTTQAEADTARIAALEDSIARTPQADITLNALTRQLDNTQIQYQQAILKQAEAATGERLEVNRQAERFEVIEQPQPAETPDSPKRPLIMAAGFVGGFGFGFGLMVLAELLNRCIRTPRDLERRLELRPIVTIPYIRTDEENRRHRWTLRALLFAAFVVIPAALYLVDQYYLPLPIVMQKIADKTGLDTLIRVIENRFGG